MIKPPLPANESERLAALGRYLILDSEAEKAFDDIVWLVSHICRTPISYISIIDKDRQWFKSQIGLSVTQTPRDIAFCAHAILQTDTMVIPDALQDHRFSDNPLVVSDPHIRFYAGTPLLARDGLPVGTLCAIDHTPRTLDEAQLEALRALGRQVEKLLEYRRSAMELSQTLAQMKVMTGLLPMCAWCKRIRDEQGKWNSLESYLSDHSEADVTHGICPDCIETHGRKPSKGL